MMALARHVPPAIPGMKLDLYYIFLQKSTTHLSSKNRIKRCMLR